MATIFFHSKRKTYYSRSYIPTVLRHLLHDRLELWRSLDTQDKDEAALRAAQWDARIRKVFLTLKREGRSMRQEQIDSLVEHWLESELDEADDSRVMNGPYNEDQIDMAYDLIIDSTRKPLMRWSPSTFVRSRKKLMTY
jgi:hypothetical protein